MEAIEQLKIDLRAGRINANRLVDLIVALRNCPRSIFARRLPQRKPTSQTMSYTR